jgi:transcriptional regulator GlxA family with amidase domain
MRIEIVLFDGFDEVDAIAPHEVLVNGGLDAELVGLHGPGLVVGAHGARVQVERGLGRPDMVLVPGGGWNARAERGAWGEAQRGELPRALAALHDGGTAVAAVCTGGMLLAAAGLTAGRPAVTHHAALAALRESGAEVVDARVVDDGDLLTAGGVTSGLDLALWIVEREMGPERAAEVAREMEHERRGPVWTRGREAARSG